VIKEAKSRKKPDKRPGRKLSPTQKKQKNLQQKLRREQSKRKKLQEQVLRLQKGLHFVLNFGGRKTMTTEMSAPATSSVATTNSQELRAAQMIHLLSQQLETVVAEVEALRREAAEDDKDSETVFSDIQNKGEQMALMGERINLLEKEEQNKRGIQDADKKLVDEAHENLKNTSERLKKLLAERRARKHPVSNGK